MVDRCICSNTTFIEIKNVINNKVLQSINDLKKYIKFGENCRLCVPYIELDFKTGKTEFKPIRLDLDNV
jgi:bacterioferritin-associated ferredoxin